MSKYTKEERHTIYKSALDGLVMSICTSVLRSIVKVTGKPLNIVDGPHEVTKENFPELFQFKPENVSKNDFWFPCEDLDIRRDVLRKCIEMTK